MTKILERGTYTFAPNKRQITFSGIANFDVERLLLIEHAPSGTVIYCAALPGSGYSSASGVTVTLNYDTTGLNVSDALRVYYADNLFSAANPGHVTLDAQAAGLTQEATQLAILQTLQRQRAETLWTDDSETYFVRVDQGGAITWTDPSGNASLAPGTGIRPVDNTSAVVEASRYQAVSAGDGYSVGDYISHVVTTDPQTGVTVGHFWLNVTTEVKLASGPPTANITPVAPLAAGAATSAKQDAGNASLVAMVSALGNPADAAATSDSGAFSLVALAKRALGNWTTLLSVFGASTDAPAAASGAAGSLMAQVKGVLARILIGQAGPGGSAAIAHAVQGVNGGLPVAVSVSSATVTADTSGTLIAGGSATLAADLSRQLLIISNTGQRPLSYRFGGAATALAGHPLAPGETLQFVGSKVPTASVSLFSTDGTSYFATSG